MEEKKKLESHTIDFFQPGEMQPERDHNLKSNKSWVNEFKRRKYREADRGGWFSCEMKINQNQPFALGVEYWGGFPGSKTFDIFVNDRLVATENISNTKPGEFYTKIYKLPDNLKIKGNKLTIKFIPKEGHRAGPVFGIRTLLSPLAKGELMGD